MLAECIFSLQVELYRVWLVRIQTGEPVSRYTTFSCAPNNPSLGWLSPSAFSHTVFRNAALASIGTKSFMLLPSGACTRHGMDCGYRLRNDCIQFVSYFHF